MGDNGLTECRGRDMTAGEHALAATQQIELMHASAISTGRWMGPWINVRHAGARCTCAHTKRAAAYSQRVVRILIIPRHPGYMIDGP